MAYIVFEGPEGSGKSTQARLLASRLNAVLTREPGGTALGAKLRALLLSVDEAPIGARAEVLLMAADRAQHMEDVVAPALGEGRHVVADRSVYSSMAYQGAARGLGIDAVAELNQWALDGRWPDLAILLDITVEAAASRLERSLDRLESEGDSFHQRVAAAYRQMAAHNSEQWLVVSADQPVEIVAEKVWAGVVERLGLTEAEA